MIRSLVACLIVCIPFTFAGAAFAQSVESTITQQHSVQELGISLNELASIAEQVAEKYGTYFVSVDRLIEVKGKLTFDGFLAEVRAAAKGVKLLKIADSLVFDKKGILTQIATRQWTVDEIRILVRNPYTMRVTKNRLVSPFSPATAYYDVVGNYVVVDDVTNTKFTPLLGHPL